VIVGSRRPEAICAGHRRAGTVLKMTHARIAARTAEQIERAPCLAAREDGAGCLALAHVGGFAAE